MSTYDNYLSLLSKYDPKLAEELSKSEFGARLSKLTIEKLLPNSSIHFMALQLGYQICMVPECKNAREIFYCYSCVKVLTNYCHCESHRENNPEICQFCHKYFCNDCQRDAVCCLKNIPKGPKIELTCENINNVLSKIKLIDINFSCRVVSINDLIFEFNLTYKKIQNLNFKYDYADNRIYIRNNMTNKNRELIASELNFNSLLVYIDHIVILKNNCEIISTILDLIM